MAFKSDKHRRWFFANFGTGASISESISAYTFARGSGLSVKESFKMARESRKESDFSATPVADRISAYTFARGSGLSVKESLKMARESRAAMLEIEPDAQLFKRMPSFVAPDFTPSSGVSENYSGPVTFKHDVSAGIQEGVKGYDKSLKLLNDRLDYLNNPPMDYTAERATQITKWAKNQHERISGAMAGLDPLSEKYIELDDLKSSAHHIIERGKANAYNDNEFIKSGHFS